ncbi:MBL fold metallo-hydrolase [Flavipsychrobacter stenotrophus]|uniref:MBL fold metallo-hydrolase n=1 Tax=Flavipsychrobacter stenotrophus TaxID=2077091 RepID=A0A2S7T166_9BACT|nr:MBL fold metallo-hydrolase [Flavipsychrobacter stenotrophus]PQJ12953.1 MBL fold metallo-hydrolase [Flavipsychrobacter stenotrophus]
MSILQPSKKVGNTYQNPIPTIQTEGGFLPILWKYITAKEERVPKIPIGPFPVDVNDYNTTSSTGLRITWMGHSSLLIEIDGRSFLTDPVIGRASFLQSVGPKRFFPYPIALHQLPKLDGIILSHDHYDHLDVLAIKQLINNPAPIFCSLGVGAILEKWGVSPDRITETDWTQTVSVAVDCTITALPARHFSGRGITNRNQTLWSSFAIKGSKHNIYFGADSGWHPGFKEIGEQYGPFDLTMLEVGASNPSWPDIHMGPDKATDAHLALNGKLMMPIHWGTFNLALHAWREPVQTTIKHSEEKGIKLFLPKPGIVTEVAEYNSKWWI